MKFDLDYYDMRNKFEKYLVYENDTDTYDTLIFIDTPAEVGYLPKSDVICVFDNKTRALLAVVERVRKSDFSIWGRLKLLLHNRRIIRDAPIGYECYVQKRGEFYEYQFYKRWWYDLSIQLGVVDISKYTNKGRTGGEDESGPGSV